MTEKALRSARVAAAIVVAAICLTGCSSAPSKPAYSRPPATDSAALPTSVPAATAPMRGVSACGRADFAVILGAKELYLGSCAGQFISSGDPAIVYASKGQSIRIRESGAGSSVATDDPAVAVVNADTATVVARGPGKTAVRFTDVPSGCIVTSESGAMSQVPSARCVAFILVVR